MLYKVVLLTLSYCCKCKLLYSPFSSPFFLFFMCKLLNFIKN
nr:MAG TPA: hypothetical protein [Caudoviricetes sp.]